MNANIELQKALYSALSENYEVYEVIPSDSSFPFILIDSLSKFENFTKDDQQRFTFSVMVHGFSKGTSSIESKILEDYIYEKTKHLELETFKVDLVDLTLSQNLKEDEEEGSIVFHSIQQFEITLSSN